jgi:hypothetical protein
MNSKLSLFDTSHDLCKYQEHQWEGVEGWLVHWWARQSRKVRVIPSNLLVIQSTHLSLLSTGLLLTLCGCSLLAAITTNQHYFNVPFYGHPHIFRDHQFWRFATRLFIWTNSSEVLLSVFVMWYSSLEVERIWGSRKFAASSRLSKFPFFLTHYPLTLSIRFSYSHFWSL